MHYKEKFKDEPKLVEQIEEIMQVFGCSGIRFYTIDPDLNNKNIADRIFYKTKRR